ncbi:hypothetical protein CRG98_010634 [Punica granatum]|uniref:Uncharacterized protein n=1 Tax=Punica granatum TaxID=22663 RepID=A0A2I0KKA5_PUNGR|nr:hypothetical protein CRG98_010634 [Punica granatum]
MAGWWPQRRVGWPHSSIGSVIMLATPWRVGWDMLCSSELLPVIFCGGRFKPQCLEFKELGAGLGELPLRLWLANEFLILWRVGKVLSNFNLVGARNARAYATRLGSVHLPGDARRTHVRMSRHLLFTTRRSRAVESPGSRGTGYT